MEDVGTRESPERVEAGEIPSETGTTFVLIHGHSFSFGLGDLRLWLRHASTGVALDSIAGIYRLLQSDYRVDYFFEVRDARNAEVLLRAGERSTRSSGARYLPRESFEQATTGLRREEVDAAPASASEAKGRVKLPSFKKTVPLRAPSNERRAPAPQGRWRPPSPRIALSDDILALLLPGRDNGCVGTVPPPLGLGIDATRVHLLLGTATLDDRENDLTARRIANGVLRHDTLALLNGIVLKGRTYPLRGSNREPALAMRFTDPDVAGRMAARAVWDVPSRAPPTAPRAERFAVRPRTDQEPAASEVRTRSLLLRMTDPKKPLIERLRPAASDGTRALMDRMEIGLKDRVSTSVSTKRRRAHNRPQKRVERLLRMEEEIRREWEEFRRTDAEIDWFIDQEESLPVHDDEDDFLRSALVYVTEVLPRVTRPQSWVQARVPLSRGLALRICKKTTTGLAIVVMLPGAPNPSRLHLANLEAEGEGSNAESDAGEPDDVPEVQAAECEQMDREAAVEVADEDDGGESVPQTRKKKAKEGGGERRKDVVGREGGEGEK
ncbi:hypothetical protein DFH08DRAFT_817402 [Mycena albidolilacea]|uniref:Uncharacterized protein n=1 Tax=Mycena albidolilacea TaxID=1033008 RepID=A0AAD6ZIE2_9AGAR|nr:hypothetical protein DFH08DRAFT_817402 [Mycena albidolilacea]